MEEEQRDDAEPADKPAQRRTALRRAWPVVRAALRMTEVVAAARNDESLCLAAQALVVIGDAVVRAW